MTLIDALDALHRARQIRHQWLPGMLMRKDASPGIQLRISETPWWCPNGWSPCLTDPATVGCLLALLREATGLASHTVPVITGGWSVHGPYNVELRAPTEGAAIEAALIALAKALP